MAKNKESQENSFAEKKLIVVEAFDDYRRGDAIKNPEIIAKVLKLHADKVHVLENSHD